MKGVIQEARKVLEQTKLESETTTPKSNKELYKIDNPNASIPEFSDSLKVKKSSLLQFFSVKFQLCIFLTFFAGGLQRKIWKTYSCKWRYKVKICILKILFLTQFMIILPLQCWGYFGRWRSCCLEAYAKSISKKNLLSLHAGQILIWDVFIK